MTTLRRYWVRETYWTDDAHLELGNPANRVPMFKADEVREVLSDAKVLAEWMTGIEWITDIPSGNALPLKEAQRLLARLEDK